MAPARLTQFSQLCDSLAQAPGQPSPGLIHGLCKVDPIACPDLLFSLRGRRAQLGTPSCGLPQSCQAAGRTTRCALSRVWFYSTCKLNPLVKLKRQLEAAKLSVSARRSHWPRSHGRRRRGAAVATAATTFLAAVKAAAAPARAPALLLLLLSPRLRARRVGSPAAN